MNTNIDHVTITLKNGLRVTMTKDGLLIMTRKRKGSGIVKASAEGLYKAAMNRYAYVAEEVKR